MIVSEPRRGPSCSRNTRFSALEIVNHVALLLMDPAGQRDEEKPQGRGHRRHGRQAIKHAGVTHPARAINSQLDGYFRDLDRVIGHYGGKPVGDLDAALVTD